MNNIEMIEKAMTHGSHNRIPQKAEPPSALVQKRVQGGEMSLER